MTKDEAVSLKNPAKVRWDIFLHATTMCIKKNQTIYSCILLDYRYPLNLVVLNVLRS